MGLAEVNNLVANVKSKVRPYRNTLVADSGAIRNEQMLQAFYAMCEQSEIGSSIQAAFIAGAGAKFNAGNFSKLYSTYGSNDAVQATALNQPYLSGNIAPNERYAMLNPNGSSRVITHPAISFNATDPWSLTIIVQTNGVATLGYFYSASANTLLGFSSTGTVKFRNESATLVSGTVGGALKYSGKTTVYTFIAAGDGSLKCYANGVLFDTITNPTNVTLASIFNIPSTAMYGKIFASIIRSGALTASQVLAEYNFFASIYPDVPTVTIGTQQWATSNLDIVCTPQGNVINEITDNANVELVTVTADRDFSSDTGFWTKGTGITIGSGTCNFTAVADGVTLSRASILTVGKYVKVTYAVSGYTSGGIAVVVGGTVGTTRNANGTYTEFIKCGATTTMAWKAVGTTTLSIDDDSVGLVGWSGLTEVYDAVYAATAGVAAVKDQAGCLAAAAWCHYNNDSANGAIYGKLYNWYAARTIQYDIDAYNAANPTTPWGYHVPTPAEFTTLQTTLGGSTVAGGKMKKEGLTYWLTPNPGADNSSGFSSVPTGYRISTTGIFGSQVGVANFWTSAFITLYGYYSALYYNDATLGSTSDYKTRGSSIRLIKG